MEKCFNCEREATHTLYFYATPVPFCGRKKCFWAGIDEEYAEELEGE